MQKVRALGKFGLAFGCFDSPLPPILLYFCLIFVFDGNLVVLSRLEPSLWLSSLL